MIDTGENVVHCGNDEVAFFYKKVTDDPILNIWFPGAYDRNKGVKQYQRHSWISNFKGSFLIFDDPTISENNDLSIGWFQGSNGMLIESLIDLISTIKITLGFEEENIRFFGSSAGGFVALKLSEYFKKSDILVINPQTVVLKYSKNHVSKMLNYSYKKSSQELSESEIGKLSYLLSCDRSGRLFYFQNIHDKVHINLHLNKVLQSGSGHKVVEVNYSDVLTLSSKCNFYVIYYDDPLLKHNPPNMEVTKDFFDYAFCQAGA